MALQIIEKYRKPEAKQDDYVFPILDRRIHKTAIQIRDKVRKANKATIKALHKIGEKLGIPIDLTTYVARHSYATVLKRSGVSTAIISESLGHHRHLVQRTLHRTAVADQQPQAPVAAVVRVARHQQVAQVGRDLRVAAVRIALLQEARHLPGGVGDQHRQVGEFPARDLLGVRRPRKKAQLFVGEFVAVVDILHDGLVVARNDPLDGRNDELLLQRNGQRREELLQVGRRLHQLHEGRQHRRLHEGCQVDGRAGRAVKHPTRRTKKG